MCYNVENVEPNINPVLSSQPAVCSKRDNHHRNQLGHPTERPVTVQVGHGAFALAGFCSDQIKPASHLIINQVSGWDFSVKRGQYFECCWKAVLHEDLLQRECLFIL